MMTRMMNKILNNAISASEQGRGGYAIRQSHYETYRGMKKIVDRLVVSGMVEKLEAEAGRFYLVPTARALAMMQSDQHQQAA